MKTVYVIFRTGRLPGRGYNEDLFIDGNGATTNARTRAAEFATSRSAYTWAHQRHLDEWRVGRR
jgi:hypothetical protein